MLRFRRSRPLLLGIFLLAPPACADTGLPEQNLSPAQRALRDGVGRHGGVDHRPRARTAEIVAGGARLVDLRGAVAGAGNVVPVPTAAINRFTADPARALTRVPGGGTA